MRVLILTAHTGGGHDSVAAALAEAMGRSGRDAVRVWAPGDDGGSEIVPRDLWYDRVVTRLPGLWRRFYHLTDNEGATRLGVYAATRLWRRRLRAVLDELQPDVLVSVHPLCARLAASVLEAMPRPIAHHCVVTDLMTVHRCWAAPGVSAFYVATPEAAVALSHAGVARTRIHVAGLPLRRSFAEPPPAHPPGRAPRVLLLGGGYAGPALRHAACTLLDAELELELVIVCGRNARLQRRLWKQAQGRTTVLSWSADIAALMRACDVVVSRAGSVTLAEAFSQGRPVLVYDVLPGQEEGNLALLRGVAPGRQVVAVDELPAAIQRMWRRGGAGLAQRHAAWWAAATDRVVALITGDVAPVLAPHGAREAGAIGSGEIASPCGALVPRHSRG